MSEFVSEPIVPEAGTFSSALMARGLAGLPRAFTWRDRRYEIVECIEHEKRSGPMIGMLGGERYLRRQVFKVWLDTGQTATLYVERHARSGSRGAAKRRWYIYTIEGDHRIGDGIARE